MARLHLARSRAPFRFIEDELRRRTPTFSDTRMRPARVRDCDNRYDLTVAGRFGKEAREGDEVFNRRYFAFVGNRSFKCRPGPADLNVRTDDRLPAADGLTHLLAQLRMDHGRSMLDLSIHS